MHKTDFHCKYNIQFLILEKEWSLLWIIFLWSLSENGTWGLLSSGARVDTGDRIERISRDGYSQSLNLDSSTLSNIVSSELCFLVCVCRRFSFSFFSYFKCQSVVLLLPKPNPCQTQCSSNGASVGSAVGRLSGEGASLGSRCQTLCQWSMATLKAFGSFCLFQRKQLIGWVKQCHQY